MIAHMKRSLTLLLLLALPGLAAKPPPLSPDKLLAEAIESPGDFDQMCVGGWLEKPPMDLPVYDHVLPRHFHLSAEVLERLKMRRAEVIPALVQMIAAIRPDVPVKKPEPPPRVPGKSHTFFDPPSHSGVSPKQVSGLLLELTEGLNAIEALPELLKLEQRLDQALARAEKDESAPVPSVDFDADLYFTQKQPLTPRQLELMKGRVVQRELLAMMLKLLRTQRFQPLLDSAFEQAYGRAIKDRAAKEDLREIKTPADAKKKKLVVGMDWLGFDPIYQVPLGHIFPAPTVPYTPEAREKARDLVSSFIATVLKTSASGTRK